MHRILSSFSASQASNLAREVDWICWSRTALCGAVTLLVLAVIVLFRIRYREGSRTSREEQKGWAGRAMCAGSRRRSRRSRPSRALFARSGAAAATREVKKSRRLCSSEFLENRCRFRTAPSSPGTSNISARFDPAAEPTNRRWLQAAHGGLAISSGWKSPSICSGFTGILWLFPEPYDWRYRVISNLLSPRDNPDYYWIPASGVTLTGLLLLPFAGYLSRHLCAVSVPLARFSKWALLAGISALICAGLVLPQHTHAVFGIARLHEILARSAAAGLALGMLGCCWCAWHSPRFSRSLRMACSLITLLPLTGILLSESLLLIAKLHAAWAVRLRETLRHSMLWHLGFWEWAGAAAFFLFLIATVLFLPETTTPYSRSA